MSIRKLVLSTFVLILGIVSATAAATDMRVSNGTTVSIPCVMGPCSSVLTRCLLDRACRPLLQCLRQCDSKQGSHAEQQCYIQCTFNAPESNVIRSFFQCIVQHGCIQSHGPPFQCPLPVSSGTDALDFTLDDFTGRWWVVRGLSRTYDCWRCQSMTFWAPVAQSQASSDAALSTQTQHRLRQDLQHDLQWHHYAYTLELKGKVHRVPCKVEQISPSKFIVHYAAAQGAVTGRDEWTVLDTSDDQQFVLIYYCGASPVESQGYQGAVIMARQASATLPDAVRQQFDLTLKTSKAHLLLDGFCVNDNVDCLPI